MFGGRSSSTYRFRSSGAIFGQLLSPSEIVCYISGILLFSFWMFERWQMSLKSQTSQAGRGEVWASRGGGGTHQVSSYGVNFSFRWTWWLMVKVEFYCNIITGRLCAMVGSAKYQRASSLIFTSGHADNLLTTVRGPVTSSLLLALPTTDCTCIAQ